MKEKMPGLPEQTIPSLVQGLSLDQEADSLEAEEIQLLVRIDGTSSVAELAVLVGYSPQRVSAMLLELQKRGVVQLEEKSLGGSTPRPGNIPAKAGNIPAKAGNIPAKAGNIPAKPGSIPPPEPPLGDDLSLASTETLKERMKQTRRHLEQAAQHLEQKRAQRPPVQGSEVRQQLEEARRWLRRKQGKEKTPSSPSWTSAPALPTEKTTSSSSYPSLSPASSQKKVPPLAPSGSSGDWPARPLKSPSRESIDSVAAPPATPPSSSAAPAALPKRGSSPSSPSVFSAREQRESPSSPLIPGASPPAPGSSPSRSAEPSSDILPAVHFLSERLIDGAGTVELPRFRLSPDEETPLPDPAPSLPQDPSEKASPRSGLLSPSSFLSEEEEDDPGSSSSKPSLTALPPVAPLPRPNSSPPPASTKPTAEPSSPSMPSTPGSGSSPSFSAAREQLKKKEISAEAERPNSPSFSAARNQSNLSQKESLFDPDSQVTREIDPLSLSSPVDPRQLTTEESPASDSFEEFASTREAASVDPDTKATWEIPSPGRCSERQDSSDSVHEALTIEIPRLRLKKEKTSSPSSLSSRKPPEEHPTLEVSPHPSPLSSDDAADLEFPNDPTESDEYETPSSPSRSQTQLALHKHHPVRLLEEGEIVEIPPPTQQPLFPQEGSTSEIPLHDLFLSLLERPQSGVLTLQSTSSQRAFYIAGHWLADAESNLEEEQLGSLVAKKKKIPRQAIEKFLSQAHQQRLGRLLVEQGVLEPHHLKQALRYQASIRFVRSFSCYDAQYRFTQDVSWATEHNYLGLYLPSLLYRGLRNHTPVKHFRRELFPQGQKKLALNPESSIELDALPLQNVDLRVLSLLRVRPRSLNELMEEGLPKDELCLAVGALLRMKILLYKAPGQKEKKEALLALLQEAEQRLRKSNYFDVLGVHFTAKEEEIEEAYQHFLQQYEVADESGEDNKRLHELSQTLLDRGREAYETLISRQSRDPYRLTHIPQGQRTASATLLFQQGEVSLFFRKDGPTALKEFQTARELDPRNGSYIAAVGLALFECYGPEKLDTTVNLLQSGKQLNEEAIKRGADPDPIPWLYTGHLFKKLGQRGEARREFLQAQQLAPTDTRVEKALKTVE